MFGYVNVYKDELRWKEFKQYKYYYCAVCNELRRRYGRMLSAFLSYEAVFTLILLDDFCLEEKAQRVTLGCQFDFVKIGEIILNKKLLNYVAWINLHLARWKLYDDWIDDKNIIAYIFSKLIITNKNYKKDCKKYIETGNSLDKQLSEFYHMEIYGINTDDLAQRMGDIWKSIIEYGSQIAEIGEETERTLGEICEDLGKFLYFVDAFDDYERDVKKNKFNPLKNLQMDDFDFKDYGLQILSFILYNLKQKLSSVVLNKNAAILENIFNFGLEYKVKTIIYNMEKKCKRKQ